MTIQLTWLGHGGWSLQAGDHRILVDPFVDQSPVAPCAAADLSATHILISHGHFDHVADAAAIANRTGATIMAVFEVAQWFAEKQGVRNTIGMNLGGATATPFGRVKLTPAWHSSVLPDGSYGGNPAGFVVETLGKRIYFACDTALFSDMRLIAAGGLDLAVLPIGDLFTMGPDDSLEAIKLLQPKYVAPAHYNTWPPIAQDAQAWARRVRSETSAIPQVVQPGESFELD